MTKQKPVEATPIKGGRLLSSLSGENVGVFNYEIKRDWRRVNDREVRTEGDVLFCPKTFIEDDVPTIPMPPTSSPITLIIMLRHPNGRTAIIVGTETTLWRYFGTDDPLYFEAGYYVSGYFDEAQYSWKQIGSGFKSGARRWECDTLDGYLILNNGADLPVTYRLTDDQVIPIYELRELAVASVGTISVQNNHLVCYDIRQIKESKFLEIMAPISSTVDGQMLGPLKSTPATGVINSGVAGVAGNKLTASSAAFNGGSGFTGLVGRKIWMLNGESRTITSIDSPTVANLDGAAIVYEPGTKFYITNATNPTFAPWSVDQLVTPAILEMFPNLSSAYDLSGSRLIWDSGRSTTVATTLDTGMVDDEYIFASSPSTIPLGPLKLENPASYLRFEDYSYIDRYQTRALWSLPGKPRRFGAIYPATIRPGSDVVEFDYPVKSLGLNAGEVSIVGAKSGNLVARGIYYDGIRLFIGSKGVSNFYAALEEKLNAAIAAETAAQVAVDSTSSTLVAATQFLNDAQETLSAAELTLESSSFKTDALKKAVSDASAAVTSAEESVDAAERAKSEAEVALTAATEAREAAEDEYQAEEEVEVMLSDALSANGRIEDLQNDGAAILKSVVIKGSTTVGIIFTETSIFISRYVQSIAGFNFQLVPIPECAALFYRNTPILVNGQWVLYAAENQFYRFDLTDRLPRPIDLMDGCDNIFFDQADPEDMEKIFTSDNAVTKEIFIHFPSDTPDKMLRIDYNVGTVSTSAAEYTAGVSALFPGTNKSVFIAGTIDGKVLRYGLIAGGAKLMSGNASKTNLVVTAVNPVFAEIHIGQTILFANGLRFGIVKLLTASTVEVCGTGNVAAQAFSIEPACWHRRGLAYTSILQSGGESFRKPSNEKKMSRYSVMVSSFSPNTPMTTIIRSGRNINEMADKITSTTTPPETLLPTIIADNYLGDRIEVGGINNPIELSERAFHVAGINTNSFNRRDS